MTYFDVQKDAALLNAHWDLGGDEGQEEGSELIELMKKVDGQSIDAVMAAQSDLVEVVHVLKQVICVKG